MPCVAKILAAYSANSLEWYLESKEIATPRFCASSPFSSIKRAKPSVTLPTVNKLIRYLVQDDLSFLRYQN